MKLDPCKARRNTNFAHQNKTKWNLDERFFSTKRKPVSYWPIISFGLIFRPITSRNTNYPKINRDIKKNLIHDLAFIWNTYISAEMSVFISEQNLRQSADIIIGVLNRNFLPCRNFVFSFAGRWPGIFGSKILGLDPTCAGMLRSHELARLEASRHRLV